MADRDPTRLRPADLLRTPIRSLMGQEDLGQVLRGAGVATVIRSSAMAINYLVILLLARWMGAVDFGIYTFAMALVAILMLPATLGLGGACVKFIPSYSASSDWTAIRSLLRRSTELVLVASVAIALLAAVILRLVLPESTYTDATLIAILALPLWAVVSLFSDVARGFGWIGIAYAPAQLGAAVLTLAAGAGLLAVGALSARNLVAGTVIGYGVITLILAGLLVRRLWPHLRGPADELRTREWISTGLPLLFFLGSYLVIIQTDVLMIGVFHGPDGVGHYAAAARTAMLVLFVQAVISNLAEPYFARYAATTRRGDLQSLSARLLPWTLSVSLFMTLSLVIGGQWILGMFGEGFVAGYGPLSILALGYLAQSALGLVSGLLNMTGEHRVCAMAHMAGAVGNVALNAMFIPLWGINGAALATASTVVAVNVWLVVAARRRLGVDPSCLLYWPVKSSSISRSRWLKNAFLSLASTILCLVVIEIGLRLFYPTPIFVWSEVRETRRGMFTEHDDTIGWKGRPNIAHVYTTPAYQTLIEHNSQGFRDIEHGEHDRDQPAIVFLGDSFTWGFEAHFDDMFVNLLRQRLSKYSVFNLAQSRYGTDQELLTFQRWHPPNPIELVVVMCYENDIADNNSDERWGYPKPRFQLRDGELVLTNVPVPEPDELVDGEWQPSRLGRVAQFGLDSIMKLQTGNQLVWRLARIRRNWIARTDRNDTVATDVAVTRAILQRLEAEVVARGGNLALVLIPNPNDIHGTRSHTAFPANLNAVAHTLGIPSLDLTSALSASLERPYHQRGIHWNSKGHRVVADALERYLEATHGIEFDAR